MPVVTYPAVTLRGLAAGDRLIDQLVDDDDDVLVDLRRVKRVEPAGMVALVTACIEAQEIGNRVAVRAPTDPKLQNYLIRMGVRDLLRDRGIAIRGRFAQHAVEAAAQYFRLIELRVLTSPLQVDQVGGHFADIAQEMGVPTDVVTRAISAYEEAMDNIFVHARRAEAFCAAQCYGHPTQRVEIVVGDLGVGIRHTLSRRYQVRSDRHALELAVRERVSGLRDPTRGFGLPIAIDHVTRRRLGSFHLRSGLATLKISPGRRGFSEHSVRRDGVQLSMTLRIPR